MGWSLDYLPPEEPELLDEFFLAVGKALYLASAFESKCQGVLRIAKLANHFEETRDALSMNELAKAMKDKLLGVTINEMRGFPYFDADDVALLECAKNARNWIAHESAEIGPLSSASAGQIQKQLSRLHDELAVLIAGDNLVSRWVYEIEEKKAAPKAIQTAYPEWVAKWVFGDHNHP